MLTLNHLVTSGTFSLDGGTWDVDNNVWVLGDDAECVVIDAPHDADAILAAVGPRRLTAILCTHAHDDHIGAAAVLAEVTRLLFDPLTDDDLHHLGDIMTRVRDHMRARPPRSAAPRKRRPGPTSPGPSPRPAEPR